MSRPAPEPVPCRPAKRSAVRTDDLRAASALAVVCGADANLDRWTEDNPGPALRIAALTIAKWQGDDLTAELSRRLRVASAHGALTAIEAFERGAA